MHPAMTVEELQTEQAWKQAYPLVHELRAHLTERSFLELISVMVEDGYRLFGLYDHGQLVAAAGIAIRTNFYNGRHVFVYDLVTTSERRSHGYGQHLLTFIHDFAKENGCGIVALESGLQRVDAHRFYERKMGYERFCYSFKKAIEQGGSS